MLCHCQTKSILGHSLSISHNQEETGCRDECMKWVKGRGRNQNKVSDTQHIEVYLSSERYESKTPSKLHLKANHIKNTYIGVFVCRAHKKWKSKVIKKTAAHHYYTMLQEHSRHKRFH